MGLKPSTREVKRLCRIAAGALSNVIRQAAPDSHIAEMVRPEFRSSPQRADIAYYTDLKRARGLLVAIANSERAAAGIASEVEEQ